MSYPLFLEKHRPLARKYGKRHEKALVAAQSRSLAHAALMTGHYRDAVRFLLRSIRYDPSQTDSYPVLAVAMGGSVSAASAAAVGRVM